MIQGAQRNYEKNLIQQSQSYPKLCIISLSKSKQKITHDITQLQKSDGSMTTSDSESAEELNNFFSNLRSQLKKQTTFFLYSSTYCQT